MNWIIIVLLVYYTLITVYARVHENINSDVFQPDSFEGLLVVDCYQNYANESVPAHSIIVTTNPLYGAIVVS